MRVECAKEIDAETRNVMSYDEMRDALRGVHLQVDLIRGSRAGLG